MQGFRGSEEVRWGGCWVLLALLCAGCGYDSKMRAVHSAYESGNFNEAASEVSGLASKAKQRDRMVFQLEQGAILRAAGKPKDSNVALDSADDLVRYFDDQAQVSVSQELAALSVNQTLLDYRGYAYDRIMMNTYKALNFMEEGDLDGARVELRRAYERQRQAVERYSKKIENNKEVRQAKKSEYDVERAEQNPNFKAGLETQYGDLNIEDLSAYADYVNPFTEYLNGLYLMWAGVDSSDREMGATSMRRVAGLMKNNPYLPEDARLAEQVANGETIKPMTYVIFESGLAPKREQIRIDIPLFFFNDKVDYIGVAFPKLVKRPGAMQQVVVEAGGQSHATAVLCDMDKVIGQEFKNELPLVITRTLISAGIKAGAAYAANEATRNDEQINTLTRVVTTVYQFATNNADLRTWQTLPKLFAVARFPTPEDRKIRISLPSGGTMGPIALADGVVNVVYIKSVQPGVAPAVRQFKLK